MIDAVVPAADQSPLTGSLSLKPVPVSLTYHAYVNVPVGSASLAPVPVAVNVRPVSVSAVIVAVVNATAFNS